MRAREDSNATDAGATKSHPQKAHRSGAPRTQTLDGGNIGAALARPPAARGGPADASALGRACALKLAGSPAILAPRLIRLSGIQRHSRGRSPNCRANPSVGSDPSGGESRLGRLQQRRLHRDSGCELALERRHRHVRYVDELADDQSQPRPDDGVGGPGRDHAADVPADLPGRRAGRHRRCAAPADRLASRRGGDLRRFRARGFAPSGRRRRSCLRPPSSLGSAGRSPPRVGS